LNPAWLTIGPTLLRRRRYIHAQNAPSVPVVRTASHPCTACPKPNADAGAAEILFEAAQHERALQLLAHAARENRDDREERRLLRRAARKLLHRIVLHVVERRREQAHRVEQNADHEKHQWHRREANRRLAPRPVANPYARWTFAVHAHQPRHHDDEHSGVGQRQEHHEQQRKMAGGVGRRDPGRPQERTDCDLRGHARAEQDLQHGQRAVASLDDCWRRRGDD
jgi:hypothetical protein